MKGISVSPVKISRPNVSGIFPRKRLFNLLNEYQKHPVTWITAPAGSGKTTLVASYLDERKLPCLWYQMDVGDDDLATFFYYMGVAAKKAAPRYRKPLPLLTPEYLLGLPTFTLRYFEKLYERLLSKASPPLRSSNSPVQSFLIVLDNYQEVPVSSMLHEIISGGMEIIPQGINIIAISRSAPPDAFARIRANDRMGTIDFDELRLTGEETAGIMKLKVKGALTGDCVQKAARITQGWAAGLTLLLESMKKGEGDFKSFGDAPLESIFDYFASEIFRKADVDTQAFLLLTAFPPSMNVRMAETLTGNENSGRILSGLTRDNFFTERRHHLNSVYQYHPLFREFLLSQTRDFFSNEDIRRLQQKTALLLEERGNVEDAVNLYRSASDHEGVIRLTMTHAPAYVAEGRSRVIDEWIMSVPEEVRDNTPWLLYWLGVCRVLFNGDESEQCLERAFNEFHLRKDALGTYLSWSGIIDCNFMGMRDSWKLDKWIDILDEVMHEHPSFPTIEFEASVSGGMLFALSARRPDHPAINSWLERLNSLLPMIRDTHLKMKLFMYLMVHYLWKGDFDNIKRHSGLINDEVESMARSGASSYPLALMNLKHMEGNYLWHTAEPEASLERLKEALEIGNAAGIHVWDFILFAESVSAALCSGDLTLAEELLKKMTPVLGTGSNYNLGFYHHQNAWYYFLRGNDKEALMHAERGLEHGIASGNVLAYVCNHIAMANVCFKIGEHQKASKLLTHALQASRRMNSDGVEFMVIITEAHFAMEQRCEKECIDVLSRAFSLARESSFMHFIFWIPSIMSRLCAKALENGIETEYVTALIKKRGMVPEDPYVYIESWPYPLKIYTFGRFGVFKDEKPVNASGKVQKKPLDMLKILIALGGKKVREEQLTDLLWPEADGDSAHSVFKMTLSRLRQLSGNENIIQIQDGRITLDSRYCWVDVWAFERTVNEAERLLQGNTPLTPLDRGELSPSLQKGDAGGFLKINDILRLTDKALSIYKGHFLSSDSDQVWTLSIRERLRSKFISLISKTGQCCEQAGQFDKSVEYYRKGLEVDTISEEFCQQLMKCYQKLGRRAEAVSLYHHCEKTLDTVLGITPSAETEAIYRSLKKS